MTKHLLIALALSMSVPAVSQFAWQHTYGLPNLAETLDFFYPPAEPSCFWAAQVG